jgi:hypothetical protein
MHKSLMENILVFSLVWGMGGSIDASSRKIYSDYLKKCLKGDKDIGFEVAKPPKVFIPDKGTCYDYKLVVETSPKWMEWLQSFEGDKSIKKNTPVYEITIMTNDSLR